jgi:geranylgeranyl diphosphate synthase type I
VKRSFAASFALVHTHLYDTLASLRELPSLLGAESVIGKYVDPVRTRVNEVLEKFVCTCVESAENETVRSTLGLARDFVLRGGKRFRAVLCHWGWRGAGGGDSEDIISVGAALELAHASCLIHDDIMDASEIRRGAPTLHRELAALHARSDWRGDPDGFGVASAILLGDLCMAWADELLHASVPERLAEAHSCYDPMRNEIMYGQLLDVHEQALRAFSVDASLAVVRHKTAGYTVRKPLELGGTLAGASPELLAAYGDFGLELGVAFQLRDDVLGVFGDSAVTGKSAHEDLREGKATVLMACAAERAGPAQREVIDALHGEPGLDDAGAGRLREVLVETGALAAVERMIEERAEKARRVLERAPLTEPAREALDAFVTASTRRDR